MLRCFRVIVCWAAMGLSVSSQADSSRIRVVTDQLSYPWGLVFLDASRVLVTEKDGAIQQVALKDGRIHRISGGPKSARVGQGGLLDIHKHPNFSDNRWLYFSYSKAVHRGVTTAVARGKLINDAITDLEDILVTNAISNGGQHFGSRLAFDSEGMLYVTVGDRGDRQRAQRLESHAGKVLRIHDDGRIPRDNPFLTQPNVQPEIYSYGHRNPQGLVFDGATGRLWLHEHGPRGGDEVNLLKPGANYGWPVITYGREYSGLAITDETHREGMEQPVWKWVPSIAPSGLAIYRGAQNQGWQGDLLVGALKDRMLVRLAMNGQQVRQQVNYLQDYAERIRSVHVGPNGLVYLLTDSDRGQLIEWVPE